MIRRLLKVPLQYHTLLKNSTHFDQYRSLLPISSSFQAYFSFNAKDSQTKQEIIESEDEGEVFDDEIVDNNKKKSTNNEKEVLFIEKPRIITVNDKVLLQSTYGTFELKGSLLTPQRTEQLENLYYVNDSVSINYIRKVLKSDPNGLVIFDPSTHYTNMNALYNGYKRKIYEQFYGTSKRPRNPYKNCKTSTEIFNLSRRIKIQIKQFLTRICFIVDYDGSLRVKGENIPYSDTLTNILSNKGNTDATKVGFYKHHYFVPVGYWQGIHSSDEWEKAGIRIEALSDKKIYPLYSVWSPTSQNYLTLLNNYLEEKVNMVKSRRNILDIGCGTGVLSFMVVQKVGSKDCYAIDANPKAVECTSLNRQILDMTDSIKVGKLDIVNAIKRNETEQALRDLK